MAYSPKNPNGQATMANSEPVVIASNQSAVPVSSTTLAAESGGNLAAIKAKTDNIPALGQALAAASVPVVLTAAQMTTLTPPAAISGFATAANQLPDGHNVTVDNATIAVTQSGTWDEVGINDSGNSITVDGAVTANAGTNLNTSALALEAGGNLAAIKAKTDNIPALGQALAAASVPVILPAATITTLTPPAAITGFATAAKQLADNHQVTANLSATDNAVLDAIAASTAAIETAVEGTLTVTGGGGGVEYTEGDVDATITGSAIMWEAAGNTLSTVSATNPLPVLASIDTTGLALAANQQDDALTNAELRATPVPVSGSVTVDMGANNDVTVTSGTVIATQATGTNLHVVVDSAPTTAVTGTFYQATQPVSGTVTANLSATDNAVLDVIAAKDFATQTTLAALNAKMVTGTDIGDVTINNAAGAAAVNIQDGGNAITVDGTVTSNLSATDNAVLDSIAAAAAAIETAVEGTLTVTGGGGGVEYTEGDIDASITGSAIMWEDADNTLATVSATNPLPVSASIDTTGLALAANQQNDALTNTQLRATAVPVSGSLTVDLGANNDVTVTSGTVTANLGATDNAVLDQIELNQDAQTALLTTIDADTSNLSVVGGGAEATALRVTIANNSTGVLSVDDNGGALTVDGAVTVTTATAANLKVAATLDAETTKVIGTVRVASGGVASGSIASGAVASGAFAAGSLASGAAVSGAFADGALVTLGAKADAKSTATDTTAVSAMSVLKQISASVQAPPSQAVTNAGTFATQVDGAALTALQLIDNCISGSEAQVDIVASLPAGTNAIGKLAANSGVDIGDVDVASIATGTNAIGRVGHDITNIGHGVKVVTTAGTDVALAASTACKRVTIQAQTDNTSLIAVGGSGVDATVATGTGVVLNPGDTFELEIDNLADVYIDSLVNGEGVRFTYFS
jgi:hypothetical protein